MGKIEFPLEGTMNLKTATHMIFVRNAVFNWTMKNYTQMKFGCLYFQMYRGRDFRCVYNFIRKDDNLHVGIQCGYTRASGLFYLSNGTPASQLVIASEISKGFYTGRFPESLILHEKGKYSKTGILSIAFRFQREAVAKDTQYAPYGEIGDMYDTDELCHKIQRMYLDSDDHDFIINVSDVSLKAHKCILYARSEFFREYFEKNEEAKDFLIPDAIPGIMHEVLLYMYSGELGDLDVAWMLKVLELAYLLRIPPLKKRCLNFFEENDRWEAITGVIFCKYEIAE